MERKLATALFVDLVDSTALVVGSDPEVVRRRVTAFFDRAAAHIDAYGGTVEKFAGDAVVAVFGVPIAHEDDAERAVRAAVAILETGDGELPVRIGIEAGEVVVESGDSTFATGEALNVAARLQQGAEPGEILIGPTAYGLAAGRVTVEPVGERALKGLNGEIEVRRVVCADRPGGRPLNVSAPYVGREEELELLEQRVRPRRPRPAGAARDDLRRPRDRQEPARAGVLRRARADERPHGTLHAVRRGDRLPAARGDGAGGGRDLRRRLARGGDREAARGVHERRGRGPARPRVGRAGQRLGPSPRPGDRLGGARVGDEPRGGAARSCSGFEDVHWAEEPLLDLVEHLADRIDDAPVLIVCLARPELLDARPGWGEAGGGRSRSSSAPLPDSETAELVDALVDGVALPDGLRGVLLEKTEGNPLFVEETVRMLVEQGEGAAVRIPDTLQALIAARIDTPPAGVALGPPPRRPDRPRVLARRDRRARPVARRRRRALGSRRPPAPDARAALDGHGRGGVPVPARADPRRRLRRAREERARDAPPDVRRMAAHALAGRARRDAGVPPRACRLALGGARRPRARRPPRRGGGRPRTRGATGTRARGEPERAPAAAPRDRARAEPRPPLLRGTGGLAALGAPGGRPSRWRPYASRRARPATGRSRGSRSSRSPRSRSTGTRTSSRRASWAARRSSCSPRRPATRARRR